MNFVARLSASWPTSTAERSSQGEGGRATVIWSADNWRLSAAEGEGFGTSIRVIPGEIDGRDVTTRAVIPSTAQPRWPPLERIAETIATPRRRFPPHRHEGVEVLTYVIEGSGTYEYGTGGRSLRAVWRDLLTSKYPSSPESTE